MERPKQLKWKDLPVHPINDAPEMSSAELKALAADIKKYGLQEPIVILVDNREEANGAKGPFPEYLFDGKNRAKALQMNGVVGPLSATAGEVVEAKIRRVEAIKLVQDLGGPARWQPIDLEALHLSLNVHRRHLTPDQKHKILNTAQKRWEIKKAIIKQPQASDREIAKEIGASHHTIAAVRTDMGAQNGQIAQNAHLPIERAKAAAKANPEFSGRQVAKAANVSSRTADKAVHALKQDKSERASRKPSKKQRVAQAIEEYVDWANEVTSKSRTPMPMVVTWLNTMNINTKALARHLTKGG